MNSEFYSLRLVLAKYLFGVSLFWLAACGGGSSGGGVPAPVPAPPVNNAPILTLNVETTPLETDWSLGSISATDQDGDTVSFVLSGDDADVFSLLDDGQLIFRNSLDFEAPADVDGDNTFKLTITADDGVTGTTSRDLEIGLLDVPNDAAVQILGSSRGRHLGISMEVVPADQFGTDGALVVTTRSRFHSVAQDENIAALILPITNLGAETNSTVSANDLGLAITSASVSSSLGGLAHQVFLGVSRDQKPYLGLYHARPTNPAAPEANQAAISVIWDPNEALINSFGNELSLTSGSLPVGIQNDLNNMRSAIPTMTDVAPHAGDYNGDAITDLIFSNTEISGNEQFATFISGTLGVAEGISTIFDIETDQLQAGRVIEILQPFFVPPLSGVSVSLQNSGDFDLDGTDDFMLSRFDTETGGALTRFVSGAEAADSLQSAFDVSAALAGINTDSALSQILEGDLPLALSGGGDIDGDGLEDFLLQVQTLTNERHPTYLILGQSAQSGEIASERIALGSNAAGLFRPKASFILQDIDGDDRAEVALVEGRGSGFMSRLIIIPGSGLTGEGFDPSFTLQNVSSENGEPLDLPEGVVEILFPKDTVGFNDDFGFALTQISDIDGDGYKEIVVADPGFDVSPEIQDNDLEGALYILPTSRLRSAAESGNVIDLRSAF